MGLEASEAEHTNPGLPSGAPVLLWCRSLQIWSGGFVVEGHDASGYRVRRVTDQVVLPVPFPNEDVRLAHPATNAADQRRRPVGLRA